MKRFYLLLAGIVVVGGGLIWWQMRARSGGAALSVPVNALVTVADTAGFRGYVLGSDSAAVEITEYGDFQCPACEYFERLQFGTIKRQLIDAGRARWRYRDFPLDGVHPFARLAAHATACADEQGQYWPMHHLLYQRHSEWANDSRGGNRFRGYAESLALNMAQYDACMQSMKYAGRIQASLDEGMRIGVNATPTLVIGNRLYNAIGSDQVKALVDSLERLARP